VFANPGGDPAAQDPFSRGKTHRTSEPTVLTRTHADPGDSAMQGLSQGDCRCYME